MISKAVKDETQQPPLLHRELLFSRRLGRLRLKRLCSTAAKDRDVINPWHTVWCLVDPVVLESAVIIISACHFELGPVVSLPTGAGMVSQKALKVMPWPNVSTIMISLAVG